MRKYPKPAYLFNFRRGRPLTRRNIFNALVFAALFVTCSFFISRSIVKNVKDYTASVDRSREVISGFEVLQNDFKSSLIYSRLYDSLLHEPLLHQYKTEALHMQAQIGVLHRMTNDNPQQTALLDSVSLLLSPQVLTLLEKSFAEIAEADENFRYSVFAEITKLIKQGIAYEENLLAQRQQGLNKSTLALTYGLTAAATAIVLSFLILTIYISYKRNLLQGFLGSVLDSTSNTIINYKPLFENGEIVDFKYVYINKAALRDYNVTESEVLGSTLNQRMRGNGTDLLPRFKQVYQTGMPASFEMVLTKDGMVRYIWANIVREANGLTGCFNEITAQKKAEMNLAAAIEALQETNTKLKSTNEELSRFIHVSSHDLKEPVRKAVLFADRLLQEDATLSQNARYLIGKVQAAHWVMNEMIEGVQRYSAISKAPPVLKPVPLRGVMQQVEEELAAMIREKNATITYGDLPMVKGDENMIRQLLHQLLHNALKFSRDGQSQFISVKADIVPAAEHDSSLQSNRKAFYRIIVQDSGVGLIGENRNDIFSPFVRQRPKDMYDGAGLGLALCKKIVEQHGGVIQAEGSEDSGAAFTFTLPKA